MTKTEERYEKRRIFVKVNKWGKPSIKSVHEDDRNEVIGLKYFGFKECCLI